MAEIRTVTTLRNKAQEIVASINTYERKLAQARADLAHVTAIIRLFEASGEPIDMPRYVNLHRLFRRHEKTRLCLDALANGEIKYHLNASRAKLARMVPNDSNNK
jgi:hypothetical protein